MLKWFAIPFSSEALPGWINSIEAAEQIVVQNPPANTGDIEIGLQSLGQEDPLEADTATHSSILAWRIPQIKESGSYSS